MRVSLVPSVMLFRFQAYFDWFGLCASLFSGPYVFCALPKAGSLCISHYKSRAGSPPGVSYLVLSPYGFSVRSKFLFYLREEEFTGS